MGLNALDILVLLVIAGTALLGIRRGFVSEVLSLFAWVAIIFVLKVFHAPLTSAFVGPVGTASGAAVLAFAVLAGATYFGGRLVANAVGARTRSSILGPVDRALGFAFGALKGLILASLAFLLVSLVTDTVQGGVANRPAWMVQARTYPLLNATSAGISGFVDRRRRGLPMWGEQPQTIAPE